MPIAVNKAIVGKEYPPFPVTVERGRIKDFARALGDLNPFYIDDA
ncbi:MAG: MaoC family dehydratase, partial [Candidatus Rokuibacteriota bacterium]